MASPLLVRCFVGVLAASAVIAIVRVSFGAEPAQVTIPAHRQWCIEHSVPIADLGDPQKQQEQLAIVIQEIGVAAASVGSLSIGMPSLQRYSPIDETMIRVTFCSNVATDRLPPEDSGISLYMRPVIDVLARSCGGEDFDVCEETIVRALKESPWNLSDEQIDKLAAYAGAALASGDVNEEVVAAINDTEALIYDTNSGKVVTAPTTGPQTMVLAYGLP